MQWDRHSARSPAESLRLSGAVRGFIITYGIAATGFVTAKGVGSTSFFVIGIVLQLAAFGMRWAAQAYEKSRGLEKGSVAPLVIYVSELIADAICVLLFAIGTFRAITFPDEAL